MQTPTVRSLSLATILVCLSLVFQPMSALAMHNSAGANPAIAVADEVDEGDLDPDIPDDHPYRPTFHDYLDVPRSAPQDQSGDRYTDCIKAKDPDGSENDAYTDDALRTGDACYVGYLDVQLMYLTYWYPTTTMQSSDWPGYRANPDDPYCSGEQDTNNRSLAGEDVPTVLGEDSVADESIARATRNDDGQCSGGGHPAAIPGELAIDVDLVESPLEGVAQATGAPSTSGTNVLPLLVKPYVFLFGQPHPSNQDRSPHEAGEGPFGPNPAQGGSPLMDLSGACGDRTSDCNLLTPKDIELYDDNDEHVPDADDARVCLFTPGTSTVSSLTENVGPCGLTGQPVDHFLPDTTAGGLGLAEVPTWVNTLPGWYDEGFSGILVPGGEASTLTQVATSGLLGDGEVETTGVDVYGAVNPYVPDATHPLWCVAPNILAEGDDGAFSGVTDPGLYGAYQADAIDVDLYTSPLLPTYQQAVDIAHPILDDAGDSLWGPIGQIDETVDDVTGGEPSGVPQEVDEAVNTTAQVVDRTDARQPSNPTNLQGVPFSVTEDEGIRCDDGGQIEVFEQATEIQGDLVNDIDIRQRTIAIKDPTLLDEEGLPEENTTRGTWQADSYRFAGDVIAFLDTSSQSPEHRTVFHGCSAEDEPDPELDLCVWEPIWDAYSPSCQADTRTCEQILEQRGYDTDAGVGLILTVRMTGPLVTFPNTVFDAVEAQERYNLLGTSDVTAQNCIVGFSNGFAENAQNLTADTVVEEACQGAEGDTAVVHDAFLTQVPELSDGEWSLAMDVAKLLPTPDAVEDPTGFGESDEVCITGIWTVQDGKTATDTQGLNEFELTGGEHSWTHCQPLSSATR